MSRRLSYHLFIFLCVVCSPLWSEENGVALNEDQLKALKDGEVVFLEPEGRNMLAAVVRIETEPDFVWEIMLDHERVPKFVDEVRDLKLLEEGENWKVIQHKLKMSPLLPRFDYVFREEYGPGYTIEFERVRGAFKELTGSWNLISKKEDDHALLMYTTYVDFGWFIPKSWVEGGINKRVPKLLNAFRDEVYREIEARKKEQEHE